MPIYYQQIPLQRLLSEDSNGTKNIHSLRRYSNFRTKEEEAKDIQAIRLYRAPKNGQNYDIVGSDIFLIEDAIKAKLAAYNQKDSQINEVTNHEKVEKLPQLVPAKGRRLKNNYLDMLSKSNSSVSLSEKGLPYSEDPTNAECLSWAIKLANPELYDLKGFLHSIEEEITRKEIELCGASLSDRKPGAQEDTKKDKISLIEKLEKCEAAAQKRLQLLQKIGPLANVKHHSSLSQKKSSISRSGGRTSVLAPLRTKVSLTPRISASNAPTPSSNLTQTPSRTLSTIRETGVEKNMVVTKEEMERFKSDTIPKVKQKKRKKSFFVTDNPSTSTLLTEDTSRTSLMSGISTLQPFSTTNSTDDGQVTPHRPTQPISQKSAANPRRSTIRSSEVTESPESGAATPRPQPSSPHYTRRSSLEKCAMVSQLFDKHSVPEITIPADFGGVFEEINAYSQSDSPPSHYDFRKSLKAMRSSVQYSVGVHNTVNKTIVPSKPEEGDASPLQGNQANDSPTKLKPTMKLTTTQNPKNEGSLDSIMHMEALNTIGLSQKELAEKRLLEKQEKHKLGIPPSDYFEKNRDDNAMNLIKIVNEGKEKRKNMVRNQVHFRKIQHQKDEMAYLDATKRKLIQNTMRKHRKYEFLVEENMAINSTLDYQESLSDFKHMTHHEPTHKNDSDFVVDKSFESTKLLINKALEKNEESLHEYLYQSYMNHSHLSSMSTLTPRDGDIHFRQIHHRMVQVKKNMELQHFLKNRWFVSILSDVKRNPTTPQFLLNLLAAIANYLSLGKELSSEIFFPVLEATVAPADHQHAFSHEIISIIRENSGVTPPQLLEYFDKNGIKPTTALLAQVKVFQTSSVRKKKLVMLRKIASATKKSTLRTLRRDIIARASVAFSKENSIKEREIVRVLSMSTPERESLTPPLLERDNEDEMSTADSEDQE